MDVLACVCVHNIPIDLYAPNQTKPEEKKIAKNKKQVINISKNKKCYEISIKILSERKLELLARAFCFNFGHCLHLLSLEKEKERSTTIT